MVPIAVTLWLLARLKQKREPCGVRADVIGALSGTYGPRFFMAAGPLIGGAGSLLMLRINYPVAYWTTLLPALIVFGVGMSMTAAPLTAAILGSINPLMLALGRR